MAFRLKGDVQLSGVAEALRSVVMEGRNPLPMEFPNAIRHYMIWVDKAEQTPRNNFLDPSPWACLRSDVFWHIHTMTESSPRWAAIVPDEMKRQAESLEALEMRVRALISRLEAAPGIFAILDTNVLLHYAPPVEVAWPEVVGHPAVRLVLPLRVVEELDEKKYTARDDVADRARRLLSQLRAQLARTAGLPVPLRDGVTIEVPVDDGPRHRPLDADLEILETSLGLKRSAGLLSSSRVTLPSRSERHTNASIPSPCRRSTFARSQRSLLIDSVPSTRPAPQSDRGGCRDNRGIFPWPGDVGRVEAEDEPQNNRSIAWIARPIRPTIMAIAPRAIPNWVPRMVPSA